MKKIFAYRSPGEKSARAQNDPKNGYPDIEFVKEKELKKKIRALRARISILQILGFGVASLADAGENFDDFEVRNAIF